MANDCTHTTGAGNFPATRWSVIVAVRSDDAAERGRALDTLLAAYWKPVFKYIRLRWNRDFEDAQDLTQGFFAGLLERELLARFDPARSRLRTFLRLCVDSFVMNEEKAASRQKRGGNSFHVALDFEAAENELGMGVVDPASIASPESLELYFEKEWVRSLFGIAVEGLKALCLAQGKQTIYRLFEKYDLEETGASYADLAQEFDIAVTDVTNGLAWARREFRRITLERLQEMCGSEEEFRREARALFGRDLR